jgi:hypothetical protein
MKKIWMAAMTVWVCLVVAGCQNESQRLADMAERTVELQSGQNTTIARAGDEMAKLTREIQIERLELSRGLTQLDDDRRQLHKQRRTDLAWAESFQFLAIVVAATMPLFLCAYLVWAATRNTDNAELVNEVLMQELVSQRPRLIAGPNLPAMNSRPADDGSLASSVHKISGNHPTEPFNKGENEDDVTHCTDQD